MKITINKSQLLRMITQNDKYDPYLLFHKYPDLPKPVFIHGKEGPLYDLHECMEYVERVVKPEFSHYWARAFICGTI